VPVELFPLELIGEEDTALVEAVANLLEETRTPGLCSYCYARWLIYRHKIEGCPVCVREQAIDTVAIVFERSPVVVTVNDMACSGEDVAIIVVDALEDAGWTLVPPGEKEAVDDV
jgi:hypothetical protein